MKKKQFEKLMYVSPTIEVIPTQLEGRSLLTEFSNNGGHNDGNDDGQDLNAKQNWFDEFEEEEETPHWGI